MNNHEQPSQNDEISENEWQKVMEEMANRPGREELGDGSHAPGAIYLEEEDIERNETNLNSKTGKERTFSDMDLYAINSYDSGVEQSEHRKDRSDWTVWTEFVKKPGLNELGNKTSQEANEEYFSTIQSLQERYPRAEGETPAEYRERVGGIVESITERISSPLDRKAEHARLQGKLETAVKEGRMSKEHAESLMERQLDRYVDQKVEASKKNSYSEEALLAELLGTKPADQPADNPVDQPKDQPIVPPAPESAPDGNSDTELDRKREELKKLIADQERILAEAKERRDKSAADYRKMIEDKQQELKNRQADLQKTKDMVAAAEAITKEGKGNRFSLLSFFAGLRKKREKATDLDLDKAA